MSNLDETNKPVAQKLPTYLRVGFAIFQIIVLILGVITMYLDSPYLALLWLCLLTALLISSFVLLFYDRPLALSGFVVFLGGALMLIRFSLPVF